MLKKILFVFLSIFFLLSMQSYAEDMFDYVPGNTGLIIQSNIKQIQTIPEVKQWLENAVIKQSDNYYEEIKAIGFNPIDDIESLLLFVPTEAISDINKSKTNIALLAKGKFNVDQIIEEINNKKELFEDFEIGIENGLQNIIINNNGNRLKILFINESTVIAGFEEGVDNAKLVRYGKKEGIKSQRDFSTFLTELDSNSTLAVATVVSNDTRKILLGNDQLKSLGNLSYLLCNLTLTDKLAINMTGSFANPSDMKAITKAINSFVETIKPASETTNKPIGEFAKNHKVTTKGLLATLDSEISKETFYQFLGL